MAGTGGLQLHKKQWALITKRRTNPVQRDQISKIHVELNMALLYIRETLKISIEAALDEVIKFLAFKFWAESTQLDGHVLTSRSFQGNVLDGACRSFMDCEYGRRLGLQGTRMRMPMSLLERLINEFAAINFAQMKASDLSRLLDAFLDSGLMGELGLLRVHPSVRELMIGCLEPRQGESVFDPSCGIGDLLIAAIESGGADVSVFGLEGSVMAKRALTLRLLFRGGCVKGGTLFNPDEEDMDKGLYDLAVSVPTFGRKIGAVRNISGCESICSMSEVQAIIRALEVLRPGGRLAVLVPDVLLESEAFVHFRRWCESMAELVFSYAFDAGMRGHSYPAASVSALILRKSGGDDSSLMECAMAEGLPVPKAVSAFQEFRRVRNLW